MKARAPRALVAALDRYRLATSVPRTAWGFQSRWPTVRGVATHDRASLASPDDTMPLVLVHGLAVSHRYLMPLAARLAGQHPVHVIDLPGFGLSCDPGRVLDVAEHADHLAEWLEAAGLTRDDAGHHRPGVDLDAQPDGPAIREASAGRQLQHLQGQLRYPPAWSGIGWGTPPATM